MTPIQDILHRIVWDPTFGSGRFVIGYRDRVRGRIVRIPFERIVLATGRGFAFDVVGGRRRPHDPVSPGTRSPARRPDHLAARGRQRGE
jgi:uncharacterized protein (UPF0248 family)